MKIGIILPIGDLNKYGYQYNSDLVIKNLENFADKLVIISSSPNNDAKLFQDNKKIIYISNDKTWFDKENDTEIFSYTKLLLNINLGLDILKKEGVDAVVQIHINQFIPSLSWKNILEKITKMINKGEHYSWLHKKYQCGEMLFNSDVKVPWIINTSIKNNPYIYGPDAIINTLTQKEIRIGNGNFKKFNNESIVDVFGEYTKKDAEDLYEFTQLQTTKLADKEVTAIPHFDYSNWLKYYMHKFNNKTLLKETMDQTSEQILSRRKANFVSFEIEKKYSPNKISLPSKVLRYIKFMFIHKYLTKK